MTYHNPVPFKTLKSIAQVISRNLEVLERHPEGRRAFEAWTTKMSRFRELHVEPDVQETVACVSDAFSLEDDGRLIVQTEYSQYAWEEGEWVNKDGGWVNEDGEWVSWVSDW